MFLCFVTIPEWLPSFFLISSNNVGKIVAQKQQMKNWKWSNVIIWDDNRKGLEANTVAFDHVIIKRGFVLLVKICMMFLVISIVCSVLFFAVDIFNYFGVGCFFKLTRCLIMLNLFFCVIVYCLVVTLNVIIRLAKLPIGVSLKIIVNMVIRMEIFW